MMIRAFTQNVTLGLFLGVRAFAETPSTANRRKMVASSLRSPHTLGAPRTVLQLPSVPPFHQLAPAAVFQRTASEVLDLLSLCAESCEHLRFRVTLGALS